LLGYDDQAGAARERMHSRQQALVDAFGQGAE
jgi:ssRNA-specific RNase YbeY (16S rRNA maturation enzyme)